MENEGKRDENGKIDPLIYFFLDEKLQNSVGKTKISGQSKWFYNKLIGFLDHLLGNVKGLFTWEATMRGKRQYIYMLFIGLATGA